MQRGDPFGMPVSRRQAGVNQQAVAVVHQPMPDEAQRRLLAFTLTMQPGIRISGRSMGAVRAFLAMEVRFGIVPTVLRRRLTRAVHRLHALHRGLGLDQRAIDREVIARQKLLHLAPANRQELSRNVAFQQPSRSLEHRMVQTASPTPIPTDLAPRA